MTTAILIFHCASMAMAQSGGAQGGVIARGASSPEAIAFNIPAQPLAGALSAFGRQAGMQVTLEAATSRGVMASAVVGTFTREEALRRLLSGAGIPFRVTPDRTAVIGNAPPAGAAPAGALALDIINVQGNGQSSNDPSTGYVATQSAVGAKTDTPILETPQSISVVPYNQIITQNPQNTPQALRYTSGVEAESRGNLVGGADILYARGFVLDHYLNGLQLQGNSGYITPQIDVYNLDRIEVLRGPASVLYGSASPAGLVNLVSKLPPLTPSTGFFLQGGSINNVAGGFDLGGPINDSNTIFYRLTGVGRTSDNQVQFNQSQRVSISPALTFKPDSDTSVTLLMNYQDDPKVGLYNFVPANGSVLSNIYGSIPTRFYAGDPNFNQYSRTQYSVGYIAERRLTDVFTIRQNFRFLHADGTLDQVLPAALEPDDRTLDRFAANDRENVNTVSVDTQLQSTFATGPVQHKVLTGLDYQWTSFSQQLGLGFDVAPIDIFAPVYFTSVGPTDPATSANQVQDQLGLYAQDQIRLGQWALLIGGRQDWANSNTADALAAATTTQYDQKFSWRAGLVYLFDNGLAPYGSYSTSFQPSIGVDANASPFKPTTADQYEVGVKYEPPGWNSSVTVSAYQITEQNVLTTDPDDVLFQVQTGAIRSRGIEFSATLSPIKGLNVIAAYSYNSPIITKSNNGDVGNMPAFVPNNIGSLWGDYTFQDGALRGLQLGAGVRYMGFTYADSTDTLKVPAYTLFDAMLAYNLAEISPELQGWRGAVNATNLFNRRYVSECSNDTNCVFGAGLRVLATISKTF